MKPSITSPSLGQLLLPWLNEPALNEIALNHIVIDSRVVANGDLFTAVIGHQVDGNRFIDNAIAAGASAVLAHITEPERHGEIDWRQNVPVIGFYQLDQQLSAIAKRFYFSQREPLEVIGVTGTNGKTTITQLIAQWLDLMGQRCGVMGTTGNGLLDNLQPAANTTGSAIDIQRQLAELADMGAQAAALEVSSHGLVQHRISAQPFKVGVFSNLSRDHLDYHGDMENYALAKRLLFTEHQCEKAIFNIDDPVGLEWVAVRPDATLVSLAAERLPAATQRYVVATACELKTTGIAVEVDSSWGQGVLNVPLVGAFNVYNVLLSLATLLEMGYALPDLLTSGPQLRAVIGRMEVFQQPDKPMAVVDYAHTPDALEKALEALRGHCEGKLWCIVGCGGDRDKGKRPLMAQAAVALADEVIFTDDNPRSEDPTAIIADMLAGIAQPEQVNVCHDRTAAIAYAIDHAAEKDIILVAGKGHEDYQILADRTVAYSDRETVQQLLEVQK
uniref:UDP-N-acetylmuramoyl-L-alanyl-D-glutamate--2, 6-diaminopimelate ligase n=1 Tax=Thaumasiovibrio occultus TaxID=1891184 RepID=UPI000B35C207|nr:UDP-N-acetylmuramoyl-L-alanyl-D-glutamate--2,6-diaminopimelate ligase [Thaumasiovibrio occultus]